LEPADFDFLFTPGTVFLKVFRHDGFFAGLEFEHAAKRVDELSHFFRLRGASTRRGWRHFLPARHDAMLHPANGGGSFFGD
jgi:hypothetical protein